MNASVPVTAAPRPEPAAASDAGPEQAQPASGRFAAVLGEAAADAGSTPDDAGDDGAAPVARPDAPLESAAEPPAAPSGPVAAPTSDQVSQPSTGAPVAPSASELSVPASAQSGRTVEVTGAAAPAAEPGLVARRADTASAAGRQGAIADAAPQPSVPGEGAVTAAVQVEDGAHLPAAASEVSGLVEEVATGFRPVPGAPTPHEHETGRAPGAAQPAAGDDGSGDPPAGPEGTERPAVPVRTGERPPHPREAGSPGRAAGEPGTPNATPPAADRAGAASPAPAAGTDPGAADDRAQPVPPRGEAATLPHETADLATQQLAAEPPPGEAAEAVPRTDAAGRTAGRPGEALPLRPRVTLAQLAEEARAVIRLTAGGGLSTARISLSPPELGHVEIRLRYRAGGVVAELSAESAQAAQALGQAGADLRRSLEGQGLTVLSLDIRHAGPEARSNAHGRDERSQSGRSGAGDGPVEDVAASEAAASPLDPVGVQIDVLA